MFKDNSYLDKNIATRAPIPVLSIGKSYFEDECTQNYSVFQTVYKYFKNITDKNHVSESKSKELFDESVRPPALSNKSFA